MNKTNRNIFDFLSHFDKGVARQNRYRVEFQMPSGVNLPEGQIGVNKDSIAGNIGGIQTLFNRRGSVDVKCHTLQMPDRTMLTQDIKQNSAPFRTPYSSSYQPVSMSFYSDSEMDTKDYFDVWQSAVVNLRTNTMNFYKEYVADVKIYMVDVTGKDTYFVTLYEAWPMTVGTVDLSYSAQDQITNTTVTMSYKSWSSRYNDEGKLT